MAKEDDMISGLPGSKRSRKAYAVPLIVLVVMAVVTLATRLAFVAWLDRRPASEASTAYEISYSVSNENCVAMLTTPGTTLRLRGEPTKIETGMAPEAARKACGDAGDVPVTIDMP